jgi:hypothetical protein
VNTSVARNFGVKRNPHEGSLPDANDLSGRELCDDVRRASVADKRRSNERRPNRLTTDHRHLDGGFERINLTSEGVSFDRDVQSTERLLVVQPTNDAIGEQD